MCSFNNPLSTLYVNLRTCLPVCKKSRQRYLWADTLCIVQDEDKEKIDQINKIEGIYGGACLSIIDADGKNAKHELHGVLSNSPLL